MALIPKEVDVNWIPSLERIYQGKVRDTYLLPGHPNLLLPYVTDRVSIFDKVLPVFVPGKGVELVKQTIFWLTVILKNFPHHLVAYGKEIDQFLPQNLRNNPDLQARAMVVKKLKMVPVESIVRGNLTGTGLTAYLETGKVCGHILPPDLYDGNFLPVPIYTPTTKAVFGHDEHIDYQAVRKEYGMLQELLSLTVFYIMSNYARSRGIILADSKIECGYDDDILNIGDEIGTGDSTREWKEEEWKIAQQHRKAPGGYDKQPLREWGKKVGINRKDMTDEEYLKLIPTLIVPNEEIEGTARRYQELSRLLIP